MSDAFKNNDILLNDSLASNDEKIINKKISADIWKFFLKIQNKKSESITNYKCILYAKLYLSVI